MRLLRADITAFGSLRDLRVEFAPGMNVVSGPNEAGKSTLFSALRHVLLTPSRLTKTQFARLLARHLPRPDGTVLEASVTLAADDELTVSRRWGDEPRSELVTADGVRITGDEVDGRIAAVLPVGTGTYASIFLIDQAQLDSTLEHLQASDESRDEVASLLRRTREETGGVPVEAFRRVLADRLKSLFDRWDRDRDRPEGGRGIENPWRREIGALLSAHYALERARATYTETLRAERELEEATTELDARSAVLRTAADFLAAHRAAYESLRQLDSLDRTLADAQRSLSEIRLAVRRWPVVVEELARREHEIQAATDDVAAAEVRLAGAAERRRRAERRALYDRATRMQDEVAADRERVEAIPAVDEAVLGELRRAEGESAELRARLSAGSLRARVRGGSAQRVSAETDGGAQRSFDLEPETPVDLQAHRRFAFHVGDVDVEVEAGDESFAELRARHEAAIARFESAAAALGVRGVEEAVARRGEYAAARRELAAAERRYADLLGEESMEELRDEFGERSEPESQLDESAIARALADARGRLGEGRAAKRALEQEAKSFAERYADQEALEDALAETRGRVSALEAERANVAQVPDGFESTPEFLAAYGGML